MSLSVSTAIEELNQELTNNGIRVSNTNWLLFLKRANKYFLSNYKMPTAERETDLLLYNGVYEYALPSDCLNIIEPKKPYGNYSPNFIHQTVREYVHYPYGRITAIRFDRENKYLVAQDTTGSSLKVHECNDTDDNGTWTVSGDGSSLVQDQNIYTEGSGSLKWQITGSGGTTTLVNSTMTAVNLTDYKDRGRIFLDLQCPSTNTAALTSVRLRIGSDASNYYEMTATTRFRGNTILGGWGLIGFDFSSYTTTGTPDVTNIDYVQVLITHGTSGINGSYRLDNIFAALPVYYQLPYYSTSNVKADDGTYKENVTASGDTILCPTAFEEALIYKALELAAVERFKNSGLANYAREELDRVSAGLMSEFPSQKSKIQSSWYKRTNF